MNVDGRTWSGQYDKGQRVGIIFAAECSTLHTL